jgi:hypothetical protein
MVEYALILASTSFRDIAGGISSWASDLNWTGLAYGLFSLVVLRIAFWAFHSSN